MYTVTQLPRPKLVLDYHRGSIQSFVVGGVLNSRLLFATNQTRHCLKFQTKARRSEKFYSFTGSVLNIILKLAGM
jgi:hypothetical protein